MRSMIFVAVSSLALAACGMQGQDNDSESDTAVAARGSTDLGYDTYGSDNLADISTAPMLIVTRLPLQKKNAPLCRLRWFSIGLALVLA